MADRPDAESIKKAREDAGAIAATRRAKRRAAEVKAYGRNFADFEKDPENWTRLSGKFQAAHNKLRQARGLPSIPVYDPWRPPRKSKLRPFDPHDREAVAAYLEFLGYGDQVEEWKRIAQQLAIEQARDQLDKQKPRLTKRKLNKEALWHAIAKFVDAAQSAPKKKRWSRRRIIAEAMRRYGVGKSTVEDAIKQYRKEFHFTDGSKLSVRRNEFRWTK